MKKAILISILLSVTAFSCFSDIFPKEDMAFVVLNKSDTEVKWLKVYLQDSEQFSSAEVGSPIEITSFNAIKPEESSRWQAIDFNKFSKTGYGQLYILAQKAGFSDTIKLNIYSISGFDIDSILPKDNTIEINVLNKDDTTGTDLSSGLRTNFAYYKKGKHISSRIY